MNDWEAHTRITGTAGGDCGNCGREDVELDEDDICEQCYKENESARFNKNTA